MKSAFSITGLWFVVGNCYAEIGLYVAANDPWYGSAA